jgi:tetratricopeptide (TPR) repeat protein
MALQGTGQLKQAIGQLLKIDSKSPEFGAASKSLLSLYVKAGSVDEGIVRTQKLIKKDSTNTDLYLLLSGLYEEKTDYGKAIAALEKARDVAPTDTEVLFQLGTLVDKSGDHDKATTYMEEVLKIEPDHADALNFIGYSYAEKGINLDKAEEMVKKALEKKPDDGYIRDSLAWVFYMKGEYGKALAEILKAAESEPDDSEIIEHLSDIYAKLGQYDKALESLRTSIELEPKKDRKKALEEKLKGLQQHR